MEPVSATAALAITGAMAAAQGGLSIYQAQQRNKQIQEQARNNQAAARENTRQVDRSAALERSKRIVQLEQVAGRVRVAQADAGVGVGGSYSAIESQAAYAAAADAAIIGENARLNRGRIASQLESSIGELNNNLISPFMAGINGALSGASNGLGISSSINQAALRSPGPDMTNLPGLGDMSPAELARIGL